MSAPTTASDRALIGWASAAVLAAMMIVVGIGGSLIPNQRNLIVLAVAGLILWLIVGQFGPEVDDQS